MLTKLLMPRIIEGLSLSSEETRHVVDRHIRGRLSKSFNTPFRRSSFEDYFGEERNGLLSLSLYMSELRKCSHE